MTRDDPRLAAADVDPLRQQLFEAYDAWLMRQCRQRYDERAGRWQRDYSSQEAYSRSVAPNRERLLAMIGGWPWERGPLEPSIEEIATTDTYTASRVFYTSFDDVRVDAILIRPHGEGPFPAVLAQHGVNHTPEQICGFTEPEHSAAYHEIGVRLAKHGYVVIAPRMIGGYGEDRFNVPNVPSLRNAGARDVRRIRFIARPSSSARASRRLSIFHSPVPWTTWNRCPRYRTTILGYTAFRAAAERPFGWVP